MNGPITTEDLYGATTQKQSQQPAPVEPQELHNGVPVEETPEITNDAPSPKPAVDDQAQPKKPSGCLGSLGKILFFIVLIGVGVWGARYVQQYTRSFSLPNIGQQPSPSPTSAATDAMRGAPITPTTIDSAVTNTWNSYQVISGTTKQPFGGVTFQLPADVLSPICDSSSCSSQGTYLPGGTRFTVAARGTGQLLADYRGTAIADTRGTTFTTKETTIVGLPALEFSGTFTGGTASGYSFTSMRGVMIALTPTTSLEINHFTPNGITADFVSDDAVFDAILKTLSVATATQ